MPPLIVAGLVVALESLSLSALFPVTHEYAARLGGGPVWTGLLFALVALPKVLFNPLWGRLSDRFGRRPLLIMSSVGTLLGSVGWAVAPNLGWLAFARVVVGVFGAQQVITTAIAADVSPPHRRAAAMAVLGLGFGLAFTAGPPLGGWFASIYGAAAVGWMCAAFQSASVVLVAFGLTETLPAHPSTPLAEAVAIAAPLDAGEMESPGLPPGARSLIELLAIPRVPGLLAANTAMALALSQIMSAFGLLVESVYRGDSRHAGLLLGVFGLLSAVAQGGVRGLVGRFGERGPAIGGLLLAGAGLGGIGLCGAPSLFHFSLCAAALGMALATPCLTAMLSHCVGPAEQGGIFGLNQSSTGLGRGVGFFLGGVLFHWLGPGGPFTTGAAWMFISAGLLLATGQRAIATHRSPM
jgi:MFS family permease